MHKHPTPSHFSHLRQKHVTVVAFGDSNTALNFTTLGGLNWTGFLTLGLIDNKVFPQGHVLINSGIGGNRLVHAKERLQRDVLRFCPDIVIIQFGGNDAAFITPDIFENQLKELVRSIRTQSEAVVVLRTMTPRINMNTGAELTRWLNEDGSITERPMAPYAQAICKVAQEEKTLLVDHYSSWVASTRSASCGDMMRLMSDSIHLNSHGHRRLYHEMAPLFNADRHFYYEWERTLIEEGRLDSAEHIRAAE